MLRKKHIWNAVIFLVASIFTQGLVACDEPVFLDKIFENAHLKTPPKRQGAIIITNEAKDWEKFSSDLSGAMQKHSLDPSAVRNGAVLKHLVSAKRAESGWSIMSSLYLYSVMSFCKATRSKAPDMAAKWWGICHGVSPARILNYGAISVAEGETFRASFEGSKTYDANATAIAIRKSYGATRECTECDTQFTDMLNMTKIPNGKSTTFANSTLGFLEKSQSVEITCENRVNVYDATLVRKDSGIAVAVRPVNPSLCYSFELRTFDGKETTLQRVVGKSKEGPKVEALELADTLLKSKTPKEEVKHVYFISNAPAVGNASIDASGNLQIQLPNHYEGLIECEVTKMTPGTGQLERHPYFLLVQKRAGLSALLYSTIHWRYGFMHYGTAAIENTLAIFKFLRIM